MANNKSMNQMTQSHVFVSRRWTRKTVIAVLAAFLLGGAVGGFGLMDRDLNAGTRPGQKREAFLSGGERSELILKEIAATLKRIEKRADQIEKQLSDLKQER